MKYLVLLIISILIIVKSSQFTSYLKIDIVEAINLHCKDNNEFYCHPYAIIDFKYMSETRTTHEIECTKNPKWESGFSFNPELCNEIIYINIYQFLTPRENAFLGESVLTQQNYERGEYRPGYLGRIILELEKLPFGQIDDWFMVETPIDNNRIMFPSCVHLRISWTSTQCNQGFNYQNLILHDLEKFEPKKYIAMCKKDFTEIFKTQFSLLSSSNAKKLINEGNEKKCVRDPNIDYGFLHGSNLTSIEEALVFKIIKRTTGENINYEEFTSEYKNAKDKYIKSYKEFFEKECFRKEELTIERINNIIKNNAEKIPLNTTNPYLDLDINKLDYSVKLAKQRLDNVYHDTLDQFYTIEDLKNLDQMDDDTYITTLNKMVNTINSLSVENKTDTTIFFNKNKVTLTNHGLVHPSEEKFFRIFALYKWNGGHVTYDELKREYMLRRKYFYCYELVKFMPTNIIFHFIDDKCPDNYLCVDPNGIVNESIGRDPREVFRIDIEKNGLGKSTSLRFKSKNKIETNEVDDDSKTFDILLNMEKNIIIPNNTLAITDIKGDNYLNKFDILYYQRMARIRKKKEIVVNKVFNFVPLLGEILGLAITDNIKVEDKFIKRETNLLRKYLLIYDSKIPYVDKAANLLFDLVMCNRENKIRDILNDLLEGICYGDDRSIKIFMEIVRTVVIDSLINKSYYYFDELHSKVNLIKTFNKPFCYKTIVKVRFIESMIMLDIMKEKITYIIWNNDTNKKINMKSSETEKSIPVTLTDNERLFAYLPGKEYDNAEEVNKNFVKEIEKNNDNSNEESELFTRMIEMRSKLDEEIENKTDVNNLYNKTEIINNDHDIDKRNDDLMKEFKGFLDEMHFKEVSKEEFKNNNSSNSNNTIKNYNITNSAFDNNTHKFKQIDENEFASNAINQFNYPQIYQQHETSQVLTTDKKPSDAQVLEKIMKDPNTQKLIDDIKNNPNNKIIFPNEIHSTYEVNRKGVKQVTINENNPTKMLILDKLLDQNTFNDMMNQDEKNNVDDSTGLFNVLKNIQNRKCSCDFLCIEIGTIYGPFDSLRPKNVTIMTNKRENVDVIIRPIIVVNNTIEKVPVPVPVPTPTPYPVPQNISLFDNEDCDIDLASFEAKTSYKNNMRFKQIADNSNFSNKRKFYRKVEYGNEILTDEIFKQGLNVIILKREKGYPKVYERTFNTNNDPIDSDAMACVIRDAGYDKIIVITGIGKWMGSITPRLIKEIKQIGGPDINRLVSIDGEDNSMLDHAFILIGRRGLCRYNGVFRIKNYDISKELKKYFPDFSSDPNDCYFESLTFENEKNKHSEKEFFHLIDLRLTLNLSNDNRFSYLAPIVMSVTPMKGPITGGQSINIRGVNFGSNTFDIKEVLVRGVICRNVELVTPGLITCITGSSNIMGSGVGNVVVRLICGLSSPVNTCNMYEYAIMEAIIKPEPIIPLPKPVPIIPVPVLPVCEIPVKPAIVVDNLKIKPNIPLFSFKERHDSENNPDNSDILNSLNKQLYNSNKNEYVEKVDNIVTDNFKSGFSNNSFFDNKDGFRKKRFSKIIEQLN